MKRTNIGALVAAGVCGLFVLWLLYLSASNAWAYFRLREFPAEVVSSSLVIDAATVDGNKEPYYVLRLQLRSLDGANRVLAWEHEIEQAAYPEEAYDELARWAPGTKHTVRSVRGDARELRLPGQRIPERGKAIGFLIAAVFVSFFVFAFGTALEGDPKRRRRGPAPEKIGGMIFGFFGLLPLVGSLFFAWYNIPRFVSWPTVSAQLLREPVPVPANVQFTDTAKALFAENRNLKVYRFTYGGKDLHFGTGGPWGGPYSAAASRCLYEKVCAFRIDPADRWEIQANDKWGEELVAPLCLMLFFGITFTSVGWVISRNRA